jgi:hypothetical protein
MALETRAKVGFFQQVRAVLSNSISEGAGKSPEELEKRGDKLGLQMTKHFTTPWNER